MKSCAFCIILFIMLVSCGKQVGSEQGESLASASALIDAGKYEGAIAILEPALKKHPHNDELSIKLLHAYAGAGTFEALKVVKIAKQIEKRFDNKDKRINVSIRIRGNRDKITQNIQAEGDELVANLAWILKPLPRLNARQARRLNQAVDLFQKLGLKVTTAGKYRNFKWGTLHVYRLGVTLKAVMRDLKLARKANNKWDMEKAETAVISRLSIMGQDVFMAYKLFGNSYSRIQKLTKVIDKAIAKAVEDSKFKLKVDETVQDQAEFFQNMLSDNVGAAAILVRKISKLYSGNAFQDRWQGIFNILPSTAEVSESEKKIVILIEVFLKNFFDRHPEIEEKLKNLFSNEMRENFIKAMQDSIRTKNSVPLKEFFDPRYRELRVIVAYYRILRKELKESDLEEGIRNEIKPLRQKIELEALKSEWSRVNTDILSEQSRLHEEATEQFNQNLQALLSRKSTLDSLMKPLQDALSGAVPDEFPDKPSAEQAEETADLTNDLVDS